MNFKNYTANSNKASNQTTNKNDEVNTVAVEQKEFSLLDLSYTHKTTFDVGKVVPIFQLECYPGDTFTIDVNTLIKMSIPSAPTMDAPRYDINFFFVPWKQVFPNFSDLIGTEYSGGSPEPATQVPAIDYSTFPTGTAVFGVNDVGSHMEIPTNIDLGKIGFNINGLPFRAYVKIWNEWYRDENLIPEVNYNYYSLPNNTPITVPTFSNTDGNLNNCQFGFNLLPACRLRDYFASCLPFIQKGEIPNVSTITTTAINEMLSNVNSGSLAVQTNGNLTVDSSQEINVVDSNNNTYSLTNSGNSSTTGNVNVIPSGTSFTQDMFQNWAVAIDNNDLTLNPQYTNSQGLGNFNITDLRTAIVQQHQNELDARAGTRYYEKLLSYWGVQTNPLEIGRTEFIGGWHNLININNIVQSAPQNSTANSPLGTVGGLSITVDKMPNQINYACSQYGIIIGLICVRTNITYSQGLPRLFTKINNFDFYNPTFEGISEQPIYKYELYLDENGTTNNTQIFGYNQPWADLKYKPNVASGYLSANATDSYYQMYTYQNALNSSPTLSNTWIEYPASALENTLLLNASNQNENINDFLADFSYTVKVSRCIPAYSVPGVDKI